MYDINYNTFNKLYIAEAQE